MTSVLEGIQNNTAGFVIARTQAFLVITLFLFISNEKLKKAWLACHRGKQNGKEHCKVEAGFYYSATINTRFETVHDSSLCFCFEAVLGFLV